MPGPEPNPFLDPVLVRGDLYAGPQRLSARTNALLTARVAVPPSPRSSPTSSGTFSAPPPGGPTSSTSDAAEALLDRAERQPPAIYKDTNVRNVLVTTAGPVLVDFDDLTLAPFGYDLAKLLITTAMTHGHLPLGLIERSLAAYNRSVCQQPGSPPACTLPDLIMWIEIHHSLTSPYLGRHGYRHGWHTLRPW